MHFRNRVIVALVVGATAFAGSFSVAQSYRVERVASGLRQPVYMEQAPGDPDNIIYYMTRVTIGGANASNGTHGSIWRYDMDSRDTTEILNLSHRDLTLDLGPQGFTFHPDFNLPGTDGYQKLYISSATPGGPQNFVEEYEASGPNGTVPVSGGSGEPIVNRLLLQYENVTGQNNHVIDWIGFDPRANSLPVGSPERDYLYISTGDGSNGESAPNRPEQKVDSLQGKLLRIDVDPNAADFYPADPLKNFAIPDSNPIPLWNSTHDANQQLVGTTLNYTGGSESFAPALPELYFTGTRNSFRMSIDRETGDFYSGDVGEVQREEINFMPADPYDGTQPPHDFGFPQREGTGNFINQADGDTFIQWDLSGGGNVIIDSINPIQEGDHNSLNNGSTAGDEEIRSTNRSAYIGGYVYRGPVEELQGKYFYADFVQGNIFSLDFDRETPLEDISGTNLNQQEVAGEEVDLARVGTREVVLNRNLNSVWHTLMVDPQDPSYTADLGLGFGIGRIVSFGEDNDGNLYIIDMGGVRGDAGFGNDYPGTDTGQIFRIVPNLQIVVTVDRETGAMTFSNSTGNVTDILGYRVTSDTGAINSDEFTPITNRLDNSDDGDGSIDGTNAWEITSAGGDTNEFAESSTGTAASLDIDEQFTLSPEDGWFKSIYEDLKLEVTLDGGEVTPASVVFVGNNDEPFERSDLNFNGELDPGDWTEFKAHHLEDLSALSLAQAYGFGDLDGDGDNDFDDFRLFQSDYIDALGVGAFQSLFNVPEPSSAMLWIGLALGTPWVLGRRRALATVKRLDVGASPVLVGAAVAVVLGVAASTACADLVHQYTFNDGLATDSMGGAHGTLQGDTSVSLGVLNLPGGGDDFVDLPGGTIDIDEFTDTTFEAWFSYSSPAVWQRVWDFGRTTFGGQGRDYFFFSPASSFDDFRAAITDNANGEEEVAVGAPALNMNELFHVAVVVDDSVNNLMTLYVNGEFVDSTNLGVSLSDVSNSNAYLGNSNWNGDASLTGTIDEFRIYDHALDASAVMASFQTGPVAFNSLEIQVNTVTGNVSLVNMHTGPLSFDYYRVSSANGALDTDGWNSLDDQDLDTVGAGEGKSWDKLGVPDAEEVAEAFLLAASSVDSAGVVDLGNLFDTSVFTQGVDGDLEFRFALQGSDLVTGSVTYITPGPIDGDYNSDGLVNAADFVVWRNSLGSTTELDADGDGDSVVDQDDYTIWAWTYGNSVGGAGNTANASQVPEPGAAVLVFVTGLWLLSLRFSA